MTDGIAATPRLSLQAAAAATAPVATPIILVDLDFASGPFRAWTGLGQLHWAGMVFEGVGSLGAVGEIEETTEIRAVRLTLALSPVPQAVVDGAEPRVSLTCEGRLVDLERAEVRRYTDADQQAEYPGDRFFEFVPALQEAQISLPAS
ncbi:Transcriptional regulator, LacI family [Roseomonas mucosa]|uniref:Transcriptional regulator, LacI family n=1 Tax=Roseomonas mucosa TaxID=207340 RepID=A0A4Y1MU71_9PROT|nr:hypothetical protein [Roseomonas mucosa]AWV21498.1 Transcriptional regulator, LacI family [Roseomonas mucosa]MDT8356480.1 hypothetical protein [Roseomonas mucosa]